MKGPTVKRVKKTGDVRDDGLLDDDDDDELLDAEDGDPDIDAAR